MTTARIAVLLTATLFLLAGCQSETPRDLVFISLDTVRRDHLSAYGYARDTSPAFDDVARRSVVVWNAFAQNTETNPSHCSMFTGVYPHVHGNETNGLVLDERWITLAQILSRAGFETAGFISGFPVSMKLSGLGRGFELYDEDLPKDSHRDGHETVRRAAAWLQSRKDDRRRFLFVHLYDAHGPYLPRGKYAGMFRSPDPGPPLRHVLPAHVVSDGQGNRQLNLNGYIDRYDAMIRYTDDALAELFPSIDFRRALVVILADHGEALGERYHQLDHGADVFDEQVRIPLLISSPGVAPRRVDELVETVDLLPTLLELLAVPVPSDVAPQGRSLVPLLRGGSDAERKLVFSGSTCKPARIADRGYNLDPRRNIYTVRSSSWKLTVLPGVTQDYLELYDLESDPAELHNVAEQNAILARSFLEKLNQHHADRTRNVPTPALSDEDRERMRRLGYVE
jgi:arylsulfatase A-like enzyme